VNKSITTEWVGHMAGMAKEEKMYVVLRCEIPRKGTTWKNRCASENNIKMEPK
jgi:hypothetical protein